MHENDYEERQQYEKNAAELNALNFKLDSLISLNQYLKYKSNNKRNGRIVRLVKKIEALEKKQLQLEKVI